MDIAVAMETCQTLYVVVLNLCIFCSVCVEWSVVLKYMCVQKQSKQSGLGIFVATASLPIYSPSLRHVLMIKAILSISSSYQAYPSLISNLCLQVLTAK